MKKLTPILINKAIDLYANEPNITHSAVAERLGITNKTLMKLRKQPDFWNSVYAEFCIHIEGELPDIVRALLRECKAGSVQAIRLLLEWAGKLNKTLDINISSPFEVATQSFMVSHLLALLFMIRVLIFSKISFSVIDFSF